MIQRQGHVLTFAILTALLGSSGAESAPDSGFRSLLASPAIVCSLRQGSGMLPPESRRGLIQHLRRYPRPRLATPDQRAAAERLLGAIEAAAATGRWRNSRIAARKGFVRQMVPRTQGDTAVRYLHAERLRQRRGGPLVDPARPKALIYANAPGRRLVLVGAMYSLKRGERGPSPGGPITRWHSHLVCTTGSQRGVEPRPDGSCPAGARMRQGSEMMHVWFTGELRSAFAVSAPETELCKAGQLPKSYCRKLDGRRRGM